ncbi:MAG: transposase [Candidatus Poribacteria bacterium]|nr:transposase [Candidatus Poribacteria bacterium]
MYDYRKLSPEHRHQLLEKRRQRGYPLHAPPHFRGEAGVYLITGTCYEHRNIFNSPEELTELTQEFLTELSCKDLSCNAWVFQPSHYHLLLGAEDLAAVSEALRILHSRIATRINGRHQQRGRKVWYRFTDRKMRSEGHYMTTINYIHYNPVKHGYVNDMFDWIWSSVHWYHDHFNLSWIEKTLKEYPLKDYGKGWDW